MSILSRLAIHLTSPDDTFTYKLTDAPHMPVTAEATTAMFDPDTLTVEFRGGQFSRMEISGPSVQVPGYRVNRHFDREGDVPDWAQMYT